MAQKIPKYILQKCKKIKLLLSDVDGVLTDGGMYFSEKGEIMKKFNTKDGMGVELLKNQKIKTIFITKENSKISEKRAKKINAQIYLGVLNKEKILKKVKHKIQNF